jgi:hypothetical protein
VFLNTLTENTNTLVNVFSLYILIYCLSRSLSLCIYIYEEAGSNIYVRVHTHTHTHTHIHTHIHIHQSAEEEKDVPNAGEEDGSSLVSKSARSINIDTDIGTCRYLSVNIGVY